MSDDTFALVERKHKTHNKKTSWDKIDKFSSNMKRAIKQKKNKIKWEDSDKDECDY